MGNPTRLDKIQKIVADLGEPEYRVAQILEGIYQHKDTAYSQIKNIPSVLKQKLIDDLGDQILTVNKIQTVAGGDAEKVLFNTLDTQKIESVWMNYTPDLGLPHESLCVSSQSGCALGCKFCYTGTMGFKKNLSADEICDQVLYFRNSRNFKGSVSFMGMGEPFANEDNVFAAFKQLNDAKLFGMGERKINVSTVGLVPGIKRLTKEFPQINLAFSLHTPFTDQRLELMPITKAYPIGTVFAALDEHVAKTHRKVFIAYIFLGGVNDSGEHAQELAKLIKARGKLSYLYHINLIRFHGEGGGLPFKSTNQENIKKFTNILKRAGINNTVRQSFGLDIKAACGQLCAQE